MAGQQPGFIIPNQYPQPQMPYPPQQGYNHQPFPAPIQQQPAYGNSVQTWYSNSDFRNYLVGASSFHVKQKVELLEAIVGWETENKYTIKDQRGNKVFYVGEQSGCLGRQFCAEYRPFTLLAKDSRGQDVLRFERPLDCSCCCGACCQDALVVSTASGQKLGSVSQECSLIFPKFKIRDATGRTVLKIEGPFLPCSIKCGQVVFQVKTREGVTVGTISKEWGGLVRELFTDADYFSMSFPPDLDCSIKAVCIGALFLIVSSRQISILVLAPQLLAANNDLLHNCSHTHSTSHRSFVILKNLPDNEDLFLASKYSTGRYCIRRDSPKSRPLDEPCDELF